MNPGGSHGTTLVELMVATVLASIVAIGFSSTLMYTRNEYKDAQVRSQLSKDAYIIDQYVRKKLTKQIADSLQIFASESDEEAGSSSSSGIILRAVRPDSTVDHISLEALRLNWKIDSLAHYPVDSDIANLLFSHRDGYSRKILNISMDIFEAGDTLELEWLVTIRN